LIQGRFLDHTVIAPILVDANRRGGVSLLRFQASKDPAALY
jgi:hypothetical protein